MIIKLNGRDETIPRVKTLADLVSRKNLSPERVVIEHNCAIVHKDDLGKIFLRENDAIEIISFIGGG